MAFANVFFLREEWPFAAKGPKINCHLFPLCAEHMFAYVSVIIMSA
jgi:hypothetical protein